MQTQFSEKQLLDPALAEANRVLRNCVHCGFCLATCPTYLLRGDELDSPRGRIYLMKGMLESSVPPSSNTVKHIDRCLSCFSCMSTCPSGVDYRRLLDQTRVHIEKTHRRRWHDHWLRRSLGWILVRPSLLRISMVLGNIARPFSKWLPVRFEKLISLSPRFVQAPAPTTVPGSYSSGGLPRLRVALHTGCVQSVMGSSIHEATIRLLRRHNCEVVIVEGADCCGALNHHLGYHSAMIDSARRTLSAWWEVINSDGLDAIVINTSGCGSVIKDYAHLFSDNSELAEAAEVVAGLAVDITEFMNRIGIRPMVGRVKGVKVAYHDSCSLRHGQKVIQEPRQLLSVSGFNVLDPVEPHICCGSAGTYNVLQPELAEDLGLRKAANLENIKPDIIAAGNLGCIVQIGQYSEVPVVHTAELMDWATGGPLPQAATSR